MTEKHDIAGHIAPVGVRATRRAREVALQVTEDGVDLGSR